MPGDTDPGMAFVLVPLRQGDTLARLGGDEFVAVLVDLADDADSLPLLDRLLDAVAQPVFIDNRMQRISTSIGVTFYPQSEAMDGDQLLRQADQAMYQAKLNGKNRYHFFDTAHARARHDKLEHIRHALNAREFVLYYQPQVNPRTGAAIGAEALIRWRHPERGLLPPAEFLPTIEHHALAIDVGEWVIETVLTQMEAWREVGIQLPVSVNIGARQLRQADFVERLRIRLAAHPKIPPGGLRLEILETSALEHAHVSQVIDACHKLGVMFALDDFGTGYSSLIYLKRLAVTQIKIDLNFVRDMLDDPENLAIVESVRGLGAAFHREILAEGVETLGHAELLLRLGCELARGFGIARPMPDHALPDWLSAWHPPPRWAELPVIHRHDLPLLFAGVEHRAWMTAIEKHLRGKRNVLPSLDSRHCHFGAWLYTRIPSDPDNLSDVQAIHDLHEQMHALAAELLFIRARGGKQEALSRIHEFRALSDRLLEALWLLAVP